TPPRSTGSGSATASPSTPRACRGSASGSASATRSSTPPDPAGDPARREADGLRRAGRGAEALPDGDARDPGDLAAGLDDRERPPELARDLPVGEEVLERLAPSQSGRAHPVA